MRTFNKNVEFNFTRVDVGSKVSQIQCSQMCSEDFKCLGVLIQETVIGEVKCFKMMNDSSSGVMLQNG